MESLGLDPADPAPADTSGDTQSGELPAVRRERLEVERRDRERWERVEHENRPRSFRTREEQIQSQRHERALARWALQQNQWEQFRCRAADRTGRPKEQLVVSKIEEYREKMEVMDLLEASMPEELKAGGSNWYRSLRAEGSHFVSVGNIFTGLHLNIRTSKEHHVNEIIRKPLLADLVSRRRDEGGQRVGPRSWRDEPYLMSRLARCRKRMLEIAPGNLGFDDVLEPTITQLRPALSISAHEPDQDVSGHVETLEKASSSSPIAEAVTNGLQLGPHIQATPEKLQFYGPVRSLCTRSIHLKNIGTAVIAYKWVQIASQHGFHESCLPVDTTDRFVCHNNKGQILPGADTTTLFTFSSPTAGTFTASWRLKTYPELLEPIRKVQVHAVATYKESSEQRQFLQKSLRKQQILHQVQELVEDIVSCAKLSPPQPVEFTPPVQERLFEEHNVDLYWTPHTWTSLVQLGDRIKSLPTVGAPKGRESISAPLASPEEKPRPSRGRHPRKKDEGPPVPEEPPVPRAAQLQAQLRSVHRLETGSSGWRDQRDIVCELSRTIRSAQRRPLERSPLWWVAHETVLEIVCAVPTYWAAVRKSVGLEPLEFLPPPERNALPWVVDAYNEREEERRSGLAEAAKETYARNKFESFFAENKFGPAISKFEEAAEEATMAARVSHDFTISVSDTFKLYTGRQSVEGYDMSGNVVIYEIDVEFLKDVLDAQATRGVKPQIPLEGHVQEKLRHSLQGVANALESNPLAVLVIAHLGTLAPDGPCETLEAPTTPQCPTPQAMSPNSATARVSFSMNEEREDVLNEIGPYWRLKTLASVEPLLEILKELTDGLASSVEFVPHEAWLGDSLDAFAERVRDDSTENKVLLLENMSVFPEDVGLCRSWTVEDEQRIDATELFPWATREGWAARTFGALQPEVFVQDSFASAREATTLNTGFWPSSPQRIMGPLIEAELSGLVEHLKLPFGVSAPPGSTLTEKTAHDPASGVAAPLLVVLGGGGFAGHPKGGEKLVDKLELMLGIARLAPYEKDGMTIMLAGELAVAVLAHVLGITFESQGMPASDAMKIATREILAETLRLGAVVLFPTELLCEDIRRPKTPDTESTEEVAAPVAAESAASKGPGKASEAAKAAEAAKAVEAAAPRVSAGPIDVSDDTADVVCEELVELAPALAALAQRRISLGHVHGRDQYLEVHPEDCSVRLAVDEADFFMDDDALDQVAPCFPGLVVRDVGENAVGALRNLLRRSRGVLWNGALGCWETERFQRGTRAFLEHVDKRLTGEDQDEEEEEEAAAAEEAANRDLGDGEATEVDYDDDDDDAMTTHTLQTTGQADERERAPFAEFSSAVVLGRESAQIVQLVLEAPSNISFISQSGDALLQLLRGKPLPGLIACLDKESGR